MRSVSHYLRLDLVRFLKAVDGALTRPAEVVIIGGAACAIRYGVLNATRDIDTWSALSSGLGEAVARARETTGLAIPFGPAGVADGPHGLWVPGRPTTGTTLTWGLSFVASGSPLTRTTDRHAA